MSDVTFKKKIVQRFEPEVPTNKVQRYTKEIYDTIASIEVSPAQSGLNAMWFKGGVAALTQTAHQLMKRGGYNA